MATPQLKITYVDTTGRAELTRLTLVAGGIAFDDHRIARDAFPALKPSLPLGQIPVLDVDGVTYPQSHAMARYAAQLAGLYPTTPMDVLKVEVVIETLADLRNALNFIRWGTTDEAVKAEKTKEMFADTLPKSFGLVEKYLSGPFILGSTLTFGDLAVFDMAENALKEAFPDIDLSQYTNITKLIAGVQANERIAAYLAK